MPLSEYVFVVVATDVFEGAVFEELVQLEATVSSKHLHEHVFLFQ